MRTKNAVALSRLYGKRDPRLLALQIPDATVRDHASGRREPGIRAARKYLEGLGLPLEGWLVAVERKKDDAAIAAAKKYGPSDAAATPPQKGPIFEQSEGIIYVNGKPMGKTPARKFYAT